MRLRRPHPIAVHLTLVLLAGGLAIWARARELRGTEASAGSAPVWRGSSGEVTRVQWVSDRLVEITPQRDAAGRYYVVRVQRNQGGDAGTQQASFVSVSAGQQLFAQAAPLNALRHIGSYDPARVDEFGFAQPYGTLQVALGNRVHSLFVGKRTPGDKGYYAHSDGVVYAVSSDVIDKAASAESNLLERAPHGFDMSAISRAVVTSRGQSRELVRLEDKRHAWAPSDAADSPDQSASRFMNALGSAYVAEYEQHLQASAVLRVEYFEGTTKQGSLELFRRDEGPQPAYWIRTEHTRWYGKIPPDLADQALRQLDSLLR